MTTLLIRANGWHVDIQTNYVTWRPTDLDRSLGLCIDFLPREFGSDRIYDWRDWHAEVMHWSKRLPPPDETTLAQICERATQLYVEALKARDIRRAIRDRLARSPIPKAHCRAVRAEVFHAAHHRVPRVSGAGRRARPDYRPVERR